LFLNVKKWLADSPDFFQAFSFAFHHNKEAVRIPDQVTTRHLVLLIPYWLAWWRVIQANRTTQREKTLAGSVNSATGKKELWVFQPINWVTSSDIDPD
jgi:hypothetical protein